MPEVIGIIDGGYTVIERKGHPANVGVIIFRTSNNESAPINHIGYCRPIYKDSIIHNLKRIMWEQPEQKQPIDEDKLKAAMKIAVHSGFMTEKEARNMMGPTQS